jgi:trimethylamine--corrinoid protein Co-methyltransferase
MWGALLRIARGFEVDEESLAVDLIKKVGVGKDFLGERHTLRHVKEHWYPRLYSRVKKTEEIWNEEILGKKDLAVVARQKAKEILRSHDPEPLERDVQEKIRALVREATARVQPRLR